MYSKTIFLKNLAYLIISKGIKTGELEKKIDVSIGYFSRLKKNEDDHASLPLDKLCALSEELSCPLDALLFGNYASLTSTEKYILEGLNKIVIKTRTDAIHWHMVTIEEAKSTSNRLVFVYEEFEGVQRVAYHSLFLKENLFFVDDCLSFNYREKQYYLTRFENDGKCFELSVVANGKPSLICFAREKVNNELYLAVSTLYEDAKCSSNKVQLENDAKEALDVFFSKTSPKEANGEN